MRGFNILLTVAMLALMLVGALEVGLRLIGAGPQPTIHRFDADLGWVKAPFAESRRVSREFDVSFQIDAFGLRDDFAGPDTPQDAELARKRARFLEHAPDALASPGRGDNRRRVLVLGDSFVLGYTVDREALFVDLLERRYRAEGRAMDLVNAGTEGWSTDQEVLWYARNAHRFDADTVVLCTYDNDLWWNSQASYRRFPKPRFQPLVEGRQPQPEGLVLQDPGERAWWERSALGSFLSNMGERPATWTPAGSELKLDLESTDYFIEPPPEMVDALVAERTKAALLRLQQLCTQNGASLLVAPIPNKAAIVPKARERFMAKFAAIEGRIRPDQPVEFVLELCRELGIASADARPALQQAAAKGESLYYDSDWHLDPAGNHAFARFLHAELDARGLLAPATKSADFAPLPEAPLRWKPFALWGALTIVLGTLYRRMHHDESAARAYAQVGALVGVVIGIALGGSALVASIPPPWSMLLVLALVSALLTFIVVKLGPRLGTAAELLAAFTRRGHWYLMPLVVVLVTIGSLLVVAASSPLVAPFIYTLF